MKQNFSFLQRVSAIAASSSLKSFLKSTFRLLPLICLLAISDNAWGLETIGITSTLGTKSSPGSETITGVSGKLEVTKIVGKSQNDTLLQYDQGDKVMYCGSNTSQYAAPSYNSKKSSSKFQQNVYVGYKVTVADGYKYSLSSLNMKLATSANYTWKVVISDKDDKILYETSAFTIGNYNKSNATNYSLAQTFTGAEQPSLQNLKGVFYVRTYVYISSTGKYMCFPEFTIAGDLQNEVNLITVTYDANGGTCDKNFDTYTGEALTLPTPNKGGYDFLAWSDGATTYGAGASYIPTQNVTLTAQWTPIDYNITYTGLEGAANNTNNPASYTIESATITFQEPAARDGYIFTGWSPASIAKGSTGDQTITASWRPKPANVYTFSYGEKGQDYQTVEFTQVGTTKEWQIKHFVFPDVNTNQACYVGVNGYWYDDNLGSSNSRSADLYFWDMPLALLQSDDACSDCNKLHWDRYNSNGHKAIGTLRIYDDYSDANLYVGFIPDGYGLMFGKENEAWSGFGFTEEVGDVWTTSLTELTADMIDGTFKYYVGLLTEDNAYTYCGNSDTQGMKDMGVFYNAQWHNNLDQFGVGQQGIFRIWANSCNGNGTKNFVCHFVPYFGLCYKANYPASVAETAPADTWSDFVSVEESRALILSEAPVAPAGYVFKGWTVNRDGTGTMLNPGSDYALNNPTANTSLYAQWEEEEVPAGGCETLAEATPNSATTMVARVGSVVVQNASSQSLTDVIKLNSSGYIQLTPKTEKKFQAGDKITVSIYNQATSAKNTGFKLSSGTEYTQSISSHQIVPMEADLVEADIESDGTVRIHRCNSDGWFSTVKIEHCIQLPDCEIPNISAQPQSATYCAGETIAALSVEASVTDGGTLSYQWKNGDADIENATSDSYTPTAAGTYVCVITNTKNGYSPVSVVSNPATITVKALPKITKQPQSVECFTGTEVMFTVEASDAERFQWYAYNAAGEAEAISGATEATYSFTPTEAVTTKYYVVVLNSCGSSVKSDEVTLTTTVEPSCGMLIKVTLTSNKQADVEGIYAGTADVSVSTTIANEGYKLGSDGHYISLTLKDGKSFEEGDEVIVEVTQVSSILQIFADKGSTLLVETSSVVVGENRLILPDAANGLQTVYLYRTQEAGANMNPFVKSMAVWRDCCYGKMPTLTADNTTLCSVGDVTFTAAGFIPGTTLFLYQEGNTAPLQTKETTTETSVTFELAVDATSSYYVVAEADYECKSEPVTVTLAKQPTAVTISGVPTETVIGETYTFTATLIDGEGTDFQWYRNGSPIEGANAATYEFTPQKEDELQNVEFSCKFIGCGGAEVSSALATTLVVFNSCYYITRNETLGEGIGYDFGDFVLYTDGNKDNNYLPSNSNICTPAQHRYYTTGATIYLKNYGASALRLYGQQGYNVSIDKVEIADAFDGVYTELTDYTRTPYTKESCGELGISEVQLPKGKYVHITFVGGDYNEYRISGLCVVGRSCRMADLAWSGDNIVTVTMNGEGVSGLPVLLNENHLPVTFSSSNTDVATIDEAGNVTVLGYGETTVSAVFDGDEAQNLCEAVASYTLRVVCTDAQPYIAATATEVGCDPVRLTLQYADGTQVTTGNITWYRNGEPIEGANGSVYDAILSGSYTASVEINCPVAAEAVELVSTIGLHPEAKAHSPFRTYQIEGRTVRPYTEETRYPLFDIKPTGEVDGEKYRFTLFVRNGVENPKKYEITEPAPLPWVKEYSNHDEGEIWLRANYPALGEWIAGMNEQLETENRFGVGDTIWLTVYPANNCGRFDTEITATIPIKLTDCYSIAYIVTGKTPEDGGTFYEVNQGDLGPFYDKFHQWYYEITPVNAYADYDYYNFEPYDLVLLTDYPKATGDNNHAKEVDRLADLVDRKPMLSFKAHMANNALIEWNKKGFIGDPEAPKQAQTTMEVLCYSHAIFGEDSWDKDSEGNNTNIITILSNTNSEKGLQGFTELSVDGFVNIATITDGNNKYVACCERQVNTEARLLVLSIFSGSTQYITDAGIKAVDKALEYLLETDPVKVSDCAVVFDNGQSADGTPRDGSGDNLWTNPDNWQNGQLPSRLHNVRIEANCIVSGDELQVVSNVRIDSRYTLTIAPDGKLGSLGKFSTYVNGDYTELNRLTAPQYIIIQADHTGTGALLHTHTTQPLMATVQLYSPAHIETVDGSKRPHWSYVALPVQTADIPAAFNGAYTYQWDETNPSGWIRYGDGTTMTAFSGCALSQPAPSTFEFAGSLALAQNHQYTLTRTEGGCGGINIIGNSWTAPIQINLLQDASFGEGLEKTVYIYNTGRDAATGPVQGGYADDTPGQWRAIPLETAKLEDYTGPKDIPAMQAFEVDFLEDATVTTSTFTVNYNDAVRTRYGQDFNTPLYAPRRRTEAADAPQLMRISVEDSRTKTDLWLLQDDQFTYGFDNGWDGRWFEGDGRSAGLWAFTPAGDMAVSAQPAIDGTTIGFVPGRETVYTFSFTWTGEPLWLNDMLLQRSVSIRTGNLYTFTASGEDMPNRFVISHDPYQPVVTSLTDMVLTDGELRLNNPAGECLELLVYDAAGRLCAAQRTTGTLVEIALPATQGVYMVHVRCSNGDRIYKVVR